MVDTRFNVLLVNKIHQGKIFRRILHEEIREPLADGAVRDVIRRRALLSGQSVGNLSDGYYHAGEVGKTRAAQLMDVEKPKKQLNSPPSLTTAGGCKF